MTKVTVAGGVKLQLERQEMKPYKRAMYRGLLYVPHGDNSNLYDFMETMIGQPEVPEDVRLSWSTVVQFERTHRDVQLWAPAMIAAAWPGKELDVPIVIDTIFRLAIAIEAGDIAEADRQRDKLLEMTNG